MKKLMLSLCALFIAGAASAQVINLPVSEKVQRFSQQMYKNHTIEKQDVQTTMPDRKAAVGVDSVAPQSYYSWGGMGLLSIFLYTKEQEESIKNGYCDEDVLLWAYGTGGLITWAGSGELGYRFFSSRRSYFNIENMYPNYGVPYGVKARVYRSPSKSRVTEDGGYDLMPLYFKIYNSTKVGVQEVTSALTQYAPEVKWQSVTYPTDPEKYTAITDTVMVPAGCRTSEEGKGMPLTSWAAAEFKDVDASEPLGDDFCVSMVFPIDWDEAGDSIVDPTWNASPVIMCEGENLESIISERPHSVYCVFDFERTSYWIDRPEKRPEGMVADSIMQPNMRYAVLPMDSWYGSDNSSLNGEPWFFLFYTDWVSLQSANKADRYVQVSPVPAVDYVNFKSFTNMSRIEIYSLGGQLVKAVNVSGDTYRMDLAGLNSGMYVARIYSEKGISSKKLVVR